MLKVMHGKIYKMTGDGVNCMLNGFVGVNRQDEMALQIFIHFLCSFSHFHMSHTVSTIFLTNKHELNMHSTIPSLAQFRC